MRRFQASEIHRSGRRCNTTGFNIFVQKQQAENAPLMAESLRSGKENMKIMSRLWKALPAKKKQEYNLMAKKVPSARINTNLSTYNLIMRLFAKNKIFCTPGDEKLSAKIASSTAFVLSKGDEEKLRSLFNEKKTAGAAQVDRNYYKFSCPPMHLFNSFTEMQHSVAPTQQIAYALTVVGNKKSVSRNTFSFAAVKAFNRLPLETRLLYTPITEAEAPHFELYCSKHCGQYNFEKFNILSLFTAFRGISRLPKPTSKQTVLYRKLMATDGVREGVYFKAFRALRKLKYMRSSDFGAYIYRNLKSNSKVPRSAYSLAHASDDVAIARLLSQTRRDSCVYDDALQRAELLRSEKDKQLLSSYNVLKVLEDADEAPSAKASARQEQLNAARKTLTERQTRAMLSARRARKARAARDAKKERRVSQKVAKTQHAVKTAAVKKTRKALTTRKELEARAVQAAKLAQEAQKALEARIAYEEHTEQTVLKADAAQEARKDERARKAPKALAARGARKALMAQKALNTRAAREAKKLDTLEKAKKAHATRAGRKTPAVRKSLATAQQSAPSVSFSAPAEQRVSGKLHTARRRQAQKPSRIAAAKSKKVSPAAARKAETIVSRKLDENEDDDFMVTEDEFFEDYETEDMDDSIHNKVEKISAHTAKKKTQMKVRQPGKAARKTRAKKQPAVEEKVLVSEAQEELEAAARPSKARQPAEKTAKMRVRQPAKAARKTRAKKQPAVEEKVLVSEAQEELEAAARPSKARQPAEKTAKMRVRQPGKAARKTRAKKQPAVEEKVLVSEAQEELEAAARPSKARQPAEKTAKMRVRQPAKAARKTRAKKQPAVEEKVLVSEAQEELEAAARPSKARQPAEKTAKMRVRQPGKAARKTRAKEQPAVEDDSILAVEAQKEPVTEVAPFKVRSANKRLKRMQKVLLSKPIKPIVDVATASTRGRQKKIKAQPNRNLSSISLAIQKQLAGLL